MPDKRDKKWLAKIQKAFTDKRNERMSNRLMKSNDRQNEGVTSEVYEGDVTNMMPTVEIDVSNKEREAADKVYRKKHPKSDPLVTGQDAAEIGGGFVPFLGEAIDLKNTVADLKKGDYSGAAMNAAGLALPFVPGKAIKVAAKAVEKYGKDKFTKLVKKFKKADTSPREVNVDRPHGPDSKPKPEAKQMELFPEDAAKPKPPHPITDTPSVEEMASLVPESANAGWMDKMSGKITGIPRASLDLLKSMGRETLKSKGFTDGQIDVIQMTVGAIGATAGAYGLSEGQDGKKYDNFKYYRDDKGKYKIVGGRKEYVKEKKEDGGFSLQGAVQRGGQQLPGGQATPISGDAIQFSGNEHDESGQGSESGIILDDQTEVEDGETMTQVASNGGMKDYFFSNKLETGGMTYADQHKQLLEQGGTKEDESMLARMQEHTAGRNPDDIDNPENKRRFGDGGAQTLYGLVENERVPFTGPLSEDMYKDADGDGIPNYADEDYMEEVAAIKKAANAKVKSSNSSASELPRFQAYGENYDKIIKSSEESGYSGKSRANDLGDEGIARMQHSDENGYFGDKSISSEESRKDFYERNRPVLNDMGINSWEEFNPKEHTTEFQNKFNKHLEDKYENDDNFRASLDAQGISKDQYLATGFTGDGFNAVDGDYGENTFSKTSSYSGEVDKKPFVKSPLDFSQEYEDSLKAKTDDKYEVRNKWQDKAAYAAQTLPALAAMLEQPDYMAQAQGVLPGIVRAEREAHQNLDRVDYTDQLARNSNDAQAVNRFIETSGGGSSNIINKMAMFSKKSSQDSAIKSAESNANMQIGNQEVSINSGVNARNAANALSASSTNAGNILSASTTNAKNDMYVDEFNSAADAATKDRRLMALDSMASGLVTMRGDTLRYEADDSYSRAVSGKTGTYERQKAKEFALSKGVKKDSQEWINMFGTD